MQTCGSEHSVRLILWLAPLTESVKDDRKGCVCIKDLYTSFITVGFLLVKSLCTSKMCTSRKQAKEVKSTAKLSFIGLMSFSFRFLSKYLIPYSSYLKSNMNKNVGRKKNKGS